MNLTTFGSVLLALAVIGSHVLLSANAALPAVCEEVKKNRWGIGVKSLCEECCSAEALSDTTSTTLYTFCEHRCSEHVASRNVVPTDAACERCPDYSCKLCRCTTGECLEWRPDNTEIKWPTDYTYRPFHASSNQTDDTEFPGLVAEDASAKAAAHSHYGRPVRAMYCWACFPRRRCRSFWYCR